MDERTALKKRIYEIWENISEIKTDLYASKLADTDRSAAAYAGYALCDAMCRLEDAMDLLDGTRKPPM